MKKTWMFQIILAVGFCFVGSSCQRHNNEGKLFIIGGVSTLDLVDKMIQESGLDKGGYGVVLPMASEIPDSAILEITVDFINKGCKMYGLQFRKGEPLPQSKIDSILHARLIYISGGDQSRFMDAIAGTAIQKAIREVFEKGGLVCGSSAGAAVMSKKMITGNELKYPNNGGNFITMEAGNIEIREGLGMLENVIIDQHFIKRKRLNRLVSVCMENPENMCVGIDESTAILVDGNTATVYGNNQVVVLRHFRSETKVQKGLLGARNLRLDVYLPGESFRIKK
jgi:cyanophycinase